ncbi:hypothetical protein M569_06547 [Genlisea aurea]|uniref:Uncharacterized protein n=1 Tax=Genlisea aurea TaxID=192259 RepID=S8CM44_9LAMI|nr:hypothetical protein M569_06547 [Genlisea aurea]
MSGNKFTSLKTLVIRNTDLNIWEVDDDARMSFPLLESLVLEGAKNLEISIDFGYILSLRAIHLNGCGERARISSRKLMRWIGGRCELYFDGKLDFEWCRM